MAEKGSSPNGPTEAGGNGKKSPQNESQEKAQKVATKG